MGKIEASGQLMLPIHAIRDELLATIGRSNRLVLTAPTGSGKTTQVPQFLLSARLDTKLVADYLSAPTLEAHGRAYPVDIRYLDKRPVKKQVVGKVRWSGSQNVPVWELAAEAARDVLEETDAGDLLIFMPGA